MVLDVKKTTETGPVADGPMEAADSVRSRVLDTAEALFYSRGIHTVGMDDIRDTSGLSLKQIYRLFPAKERLVVAVLERRDVRWRGDLAAHVESHRDPETRILAVFDWLEAWFVEPGFRGCAWVNVYGELGPVSPLIAKQARQHKAELRSYLGRLVTAAGLTTDVADFITLLVEGAMVTAGISGSPAAASQARAAARALIRAAKKHSAAAPSGTEAVREPTVRPLTNP